MPNRDETGDVPATFPEMPVTEGQVHGYVGDVKTIPVEESEPGHTNVEPAPEAETADTRSKRTVGESRGR